MTQKNEKLYTAKELAVELRRSYQFVSRMRSRGFAMPGGTATLEEARAFLRKMPSPFSQRAARAEAGVLTGR